jgi:diaminopimelate decarboxylase
VPAHPLAAAERLWPERPALPASRRDKHRSRCFSHLTRIPLMSSSTPSSSRPLPGAPFLHRNADGSLYFEQIELRALAQRHGTPLYVYSRQAMLSALSGYQQALADRDHLICFAVKANSNIAVLQTFARAGCGFDIVSGGELQRVLAAGASASKVVFSGVGKSRTEMAQALEAGVRCFNVESIPELDVLDEVARAHGVRAPISLRVNPDVDPKTHPYISTGLKGNKFGIAHAFAPEMYRRAAERAGLQVTGIDCHIGSQITEIDPYLDALERVLDLVEAVEGCGIPLHHLDLGGGLGITYADEAPPTPAELFTPLLARIDARGHAHRQILIEPGRSLVGNAGVLLTEVMFLKPGEQKNFCVVDAGMNDLMRPAMYEAWMDIVNCQTRAEARPSTWDVVGPVCESGDWLGRDRLLSVQAGDRLAVLSAGAYGMSMSSTYNTRGRAAEIMVDGDQSWLIRARETTADLIRLEQLLP